MYAKQKVVNIVKELPETMNYGEILEILSALYVQKYAYIDQGVSESEKKEKYLRELILT